MFFETPLVRDHEHLAFIRELPCIRCESYNSVPAHIRIGTDGGMSRKPSDYWTVPLCHTCHDRQHKRGERTFWGDNLERAKWLARELFKVSGEFGAAMKLIEGNRL
jgi:hypothetical protein